VAFDHRPPPKNRRAVLASLGGQLPSVKYDSCANIDFAELVLCTGLSGLKIEYGDIKPTLSTNPIDAETFLPQWRKLYVDSCLGRESRLFENVRPSMEDLYIHCVHLVISGASKSKWEFTPHPWPQLQRLKFLCPCKILTFNKLRQSSLSCFICSLALYDSPLTFFPSKKAVWKNQEILKQDFIKCLN